MSARPRDENGHFVSTETVEADGQVIFYLTEFESRVIANRLERASKRYKNMLEDLDAPVQLRQDCEYWANRFYDVCSTRNDCDEEYYNNRKKRHVDANNTVQVKMSDYECWSLGNRLYEIGNWFEQKGYEPIAQETQWLARRFHAEKKEQMND